MNYHELEMRAVYGRTLNELMDENPDVFCLEADLSKASGTNPEVAQKHPQNFVNVGVSEANMICVGAGLANEGKIPFCASFTCFASRRVYDQITISVAYANNNVKIVGTAPGITAGANGGTHMCFQDLAIMRAMPNMTVVTAADGHELRALIPLVGEYPGPVYLRLSRTAPPHVSKHDAPIIIGKGRVLREGNDVTLMTLGIPLARTLAAQQDLGDQGISARVVEMHTLRPLDKDLILQCAEETQGIVTIEEHSIIGGLYGAVAETLAQSRPTATRASARTTT